MDDIPVIRVAVPAETVAVAVAFRQIAQQVEAMTAPVRHLAKQHTEMVDGIRRGVARQRAEYDAAVEPLGIPKGLTHDARLSLLAVRVKVSARKLGSVAAGRFAEVVRLLVALMLDDGDERAAKRVAALAKLANFFEPVPHDRSTDVHEHRAPPDEVLVLVIPHAPPSLPGCLHLTEAALARAA